MEAETITLGGREFRPVVGATIEHDYWLMGHIRRAGIDRCALEEGESPDDYALRLMREVINSGEAFTLLGGTLIPADKKVTDWTPAIAQETAEFLKRLTDPNDKQKLNGCTASLLAGFFSSGLASLETSRRYSIPEPGPQNDRSAVH